MTTTLTKKVRFSANERLDLTDKNAEVDLSDTTLAEYHKQLLSASLDGRVFKGFKTTTTTGPNSGFLIPASEGKAIDRNGNVCLMDGSIPLAASLVSNAISYIHLYYVETNSDPANRRFYSGGAEVVQNTNTRRTRTCGLYAATASYGTPGLSGFSATAVISGATRQLIPLYAVVVNVANNVEAVVDYRPLFAPGIGSAGINQYDAEESNPDFPHDFAPSADLATIGITDIRETLVAITDRLKQIKNTTAWWTDSFDMLQLNARSSAPTDYVEGAVYADSELQRLQYYNGTAWSSLISSLDFDDSLFVHIAGDETITGTKTFSDDTTTEPLIVSSGHAEGTGMVIDTDTDGANAVYAFKRHDVRQFNLGIGNANGLGINTFFGASGDLTTNYFAVPASGEFISFYGFVTKRNDPNCVGIYQPQGGSGGEEWWVGAIRAGTNQVGPTGSWSWWNQTRTVLYGSILNAGRWVLPGYTTQPTMSIGSMEVQAFGLANSWIGDNFYFNGTRFTRRSTGVATAIYHLGGEISARVAPNGLADSEILLGGTVGWLVDNNGDFYIPEHDSIDYLATDVTGRIIPADTPLLPVTGDGWVHIVAGVEQSAASVPTPTDIGLGNVTNDAQLLRAANDFTSFTAKATPVAADVLLLEDSADSYSKKKVTLSSIIPSGQAQNYTLEDLNIIVDYTAGYDGPATGEVQFRSQADITAYLTSKSATAFKFVTKVWDNAIPQFVRHRINFKLLAGVHRPENPLPADAQAAWDFCRASQAPKVFSEFGGPNIKGNDSIAALYSTWESLLGDLTVTSYSNYSPDSGITPSSITVSGTPFGADNSLVGYFAVTNDYWNPRAICGNTANTLYLMNQGSGTPTTVRVMSPSVIMRNSYNDTSKVSLRVFNFDGWVPGAAPSPYLEAIRVDQMGNAIGLRVKDTIVGTWLCLFDHARQKNLYGISEKFDTCVDIGVSNFSSRGTPGGSLSTTCMRGTRYATVPGTSFSAPINFTGRFAKDTASILALTNGVVGGFYNVAATFSKGTINHNSWRWVDWTGSYTVLINFNDCRLIFGGSQATLSGFSRCEAGCSLYRCDWVGTINSVNHFMFDGQTGNNVMLSFWDDNRTVEGPIRLRQGLTANAGKPTGIIGPRNDLMFAPVCDLVGSGGGPIDIYDSDYSENVVARTYTWAQLDALCWPRNQPGGTLLGAVEVVGVDAGTTLGATASLAFVFSGETLAYQAPSDSSYGAAVAVGGGGIFTLLSGNGKGIQVRIEQGALPGADDTQAFEVTRGFVWWPWTQNRIARRYA
jgi:hypothetical protein